MNAGHLKMTMAQDWETRAENKRQSILDSIPAKWKIQTAVPSPEHQRDVTGAYIQQYLGKKEVEITESDAVEIAAQVASGRWSAVEVTEAFCHRAALAHQLVSCLHEIFFEAALADAKALDEYFAQHKKPIGPLHGVPVSLKDQFHVKGVETTMGYLGWCSTPSSKGNPNDPQELGFESEIVHELRNLGAVLFCKTAVPQALMSGETVNNIIKYTPNPKNRHLTAGGSSGGEGALIGLRGSPLGFGTDIAGSIRIPAGFNGLYGLRPSNGRIPYEGAAESMDGQNSIIAVAGPIATSAASITLAVKSVLSQSPHLYDPLVIDLPWRTAEEDFIRSLTSTSPSSTSGLCLAYFKSDGIVTPQPPVVRAIDACLDALTAAGHKVIPWNPNPSHAELMGWLFNPLLFDGGKEIHSALALSGEPPVPQIAANFGHEPSAETTASQIAAHNVKQRKDKKRYLDYWNSTAGLTGTGRPVDGIIAPLAPYPAARREMFKYPGFGAWVNGLDLPSVAMPVLTVDKNIDKSYPEGFQPLSESDREVMDAWDPELYDGAHVGVQIVGGRRLTEERILTLAEYIGGLLHGGK